MKELLLETHPLLDFEGPGYHQQLSTELKPLLDPSLTASAS